jgi:hypothetical protein
MARGNGGDDVFVTDDDRKSFLFHLGQVCASHGWKVHAYPWSSLPSHQKGNGADWLVSERIPRAFQLARL